MHSVLVVDDDHELRESVSGWIRCPEFEVQEAQCAQSALECMQKSPADIALCDVSMASRDGVWLAWQLRSQFPQTAIIMATALRDCETAVSALRNDVVDYLLKPFDRARVLEAVMLGRDWHAVSQGTDELHHALQDRLRNRRASLATMLAEAQTTERAALDGLISMLQLHERDGRGHATRVSQITMALADELGTHTNDELAVLEQGALLHDIGKLDISTSILNKPASLDDHEWEVMRTHPRLGYDLLKTMPRFDGAASLVLAHHESFDGSGYPYGLKGHKIPLGARILSIADAYDSMTHPHIQRPPMPPTMAMDEIERCSGSQFDPEIAEALGAVLARAATEESAAARPLGGPQGPALRSLQVHM